VEEVEIASRLHFHRKVEVGRPRNKKTVPGNWHGFFCALSAILNVIFREVYLYQVEEVALANENQNAEEKPDESQPANSF
jgi:hypothetical protein